MTLSSFKDTWRTSTRIKMLHHGHYESLKIHINNHSIHFIHIFHI